MRKHGQGSHQKHNEEVKCPESNRSCVQTDLVGKLDLDRNTQTNTIGAETDHASLDSGLAMQMNHHWYLVGAMQMLAPKGMVYKMNTPSSRLLSTHFAML